MKAAIWTEENSIVLEEREIPEINENEVLIKVAYTGICGSDFTVLHGKHISAKPPIILGHEFSGVIEKSLSPDFQKGDRVVVEPLISCGKCRACIYGLNHVCTNLQLIGIHKNGSFAAFVKAHRNNVFRIPKNIDLMEATLVEPLSVAVHSINMSGIKFGDNVLITGAGVIGIFCGIAALSCGANNVIITDLSKFRLDIAKKFGLITFNPTKDGDFLNFINKLTDKNGVDIVFECTGSPNIIEFSLQCLAIRGTLVQVGISKKPIEADFRSVAYKEHKIIGVRAYAKGDFKTSINFIASKKIDLSPIITKIFDLNTINEAFKMAENKEMALKILISTKDLK